MVPAPSHLYVRVHSHIVKSVDRLLSDFAINIIF